MRSPCFRLKTYIRDGEQGCRGRPRPVGRVVYCSTIWLFPNNPWYGRNLPNGVANLPRSRTLKCYGRFALPTGFCPNFRQFASQSQNVTQSVTEYDGTSVVNSGKPEGSLYELAKRLIVMNWGLNDDVRIRLC